MFGLFKKKYDEAIHCDTSFSKMISLRQRLYEKLDELVKQTEKGSDEQIRYIVMKANLLNSEAEVNSLNLEPVVPKDHLKLRKCSEDALNIISSPMTDDNQKLPMLIYAYVCACVGIGTSYRKENSYDSETGKFWYKRAYDIYETFIKVYKIEEAWDGKKLFDITDQDLSDNGKYYHERRNLRMIISVASIRLVNFYTFDPELYVKYGLTALHVMRRSLKGNHINHFREKQDAFAALDLLVSYLIALGRYKQANYLLGIAIYYSVKTIRDSCPDDVKFAIKKLQGRFSMTYAILGELIVKLSLHWYQHPQARSEVEQVFMKSNVEESVGTELMEVGAGIYQSEIPIKVIEAIEDIKKVAKKSLLWLKRANTLKEKNSTNEKVLREIKEDLEKHLETCEKLLG